MAQPAALLGWWNYALASVGLAMLAAGYLALGQGPYDSTLSLTLAPLLLVAAYCVVLPLAVVVDPLAGPRALWPRDWRAIVRDPGAWTATLVGLCAFAIYTTTAAPTLTLWDSGELVAASRVLGITHPPGAPLFVLWGRLATLMPFPLDVAARVNHLSVVFATATAVMVALVLGELIQRAQQRQHSPERTAAAATRIARWGGAAVGALALAFSDAQWANALEAEVYAPYLFFTVLVLWLLLRWVPRRHDPGADRLLLLAAYVTGLALGVHVLHALALPAMLLILILGQERLTPARFAWQVAAGLLGVAFVYPGVVQGVPWLLNRLELTGLLLLVCGVPLAAAAVVRAGGRARGVIALSVVLVSARVLDLCDGGGPFDARPAHRSGRPADVRALQHLHGAGAVRAVVDHRPAGAAVGLPDQEDVRAVLRLAVHRERRRAWPGWPLVDAGVDARALGASPAARTGRDGCALPLRLAHRERDPGALPDAEPDGHPVHQPGGSPGARARLLVHRLVHGVRALDWAWERRRSPKGRAGGWRRCRGRAAAGPRQRVRR